MRSQSATASAMWHAQEAEALGGAQGGLDLAGAAEGDAEAVLAALGAERVALGDVEWHRLNSADQLVTQRSMRGLDGGQRAADGAKEIIGRIEDVERGVGGSSGLKGELQTTRRRPRRAPALNSRP